MTTPIPQPPGIPLLGNIFDVNPSNTWASLKTLYEKYGDIFQISVLGHKLVFIANAALAEEVCDEKRFRKFVGGPIIEIRQAVHCSLFTAFEDEPAWAVHHRIIAPLLTPESLSGHFEEMRNTTYELISKWKALPKQSTVSAVKELNRLNLEATTLTLYGKKLNSLSGPEHPMIEGMELSTSEAMKRPNRPKLLNTLVHGSKFSKSIKVMRDYASDIVKTRRDNPTDRKDLLWALMHAKDPETNQSLSDESVVDEIVTMPIGSSTAPCLLATAIYYLCKNPTVIQEARKEIDSVIGSEPFTHAHLSKLPYCEGVYRESLRLSFAAPGFNIEPIPGTQGPVQLAGGKYEIAPDQAMIVLLAGVNRDPAVFEEPEQFRPERMVGDKYDRLPSGVKKGFGNGKRVCVGQHYAYQWAFSTLVILMKEVDFEMANPTYQLDRDGWFNIRPIDFAVKITVKAT